ncbi:MAG TPA: hypothetical protein VLX12_09525 [Syntrophorhabdales bacterium]|nr:hypothetical protein [Syntrophorhabdales bacterium]
MNGLRVYGIKDGEMTEGHTVKTSCNRLTVFLLSMLMLLLLAGLAWATPSSTYWTPMTPDIQSFGVLHIGVDNYFTIGKNTRAGGGNFPTDVGLTMGVLPFEKLQMEVGVDMLEPENWEPDGNQFHVSPYSYNAKLGSPEGVLFKESPALYVGYFAGGFAHHNVPSNLTALDTFYGTIGKTIPYIGRISVGPYIGNSRALVNSYGSKADTGWMVAFDHGFLPVKDKEGKDEYNRLVLAADYASGNNVLGGGGVGVYYYFTKDISLLTGPVWFNEPNINGKWKWTVQLDINVDVLSKLFSKK